MTEPGESPTPRASKRARQRAEFDATVADIEAQVRATNAKIEAQVRATNAIIEERTGRNLVAAVAIGIVFGAAFIASLIFLTWIFMIFAAALMVFLALELTAAFRATGRNVPRIPSAIAAVGVIVATFYWHSEGQWLVLLAGMAFITVWRLVEAIIPARRKSARELGYDLLAGLFIQAYAIFLGSFTVLLASEQNSHLWVLGLLIVVVSTDTGAYVTGLLLGRHKMAPRISPKKTWEGFAGSIVAAQIASFLVGWLLLHISVLDGVIFGVAIALTATVGDLVESLIKRDLGIKDISNWLPGHGGFLDRLDSVLPSAAVAYALFLIFNAAG
ncbi:MAG: phosphatidate cytidylyltransferase [Actinomycetota bacterium]|jgi:phosphatidate cytidylyltransferase|nr:phosphatidate cytidylyltransferase [Actinomycetota bacterium]